MLTGYNTDFKFQGKVYHVQTEDGGVNSPYIISLLYFQGAILASRKTSYSDILKAEILDEVVREIMMEQHKQMIRDLMQGKIDLTLGNAPHEATYKPGPSPKAAVAPAAVPKKEAAPVAAPVAAPAPVVKPAPPPPPPPPPPPMPKEEDVAEKSLDDIILDFLSQEQTDKNQKKK